MKTSIGKIAPLVIAMMVFSLDISIGHYGGGEINDLVAEEYGVENEGWLDPAFVVLLELMPGYCGLEDFQAQGV